MKKQSGFTLIETLVYLALFAIIIGGVLVATMNIIETSSKTQGKVSTQDETNFLLRKLDWALTNVSSVSLPVSGAGTTLCVIKADLPAGQNPVAFDLSAGKLRIQRGIVTCIPTNAATPLNSDNLRVSSVTFNHQGSGSQAEYVRVSFTVDSQTFTTTKYLRK